jgi:uncharacterized protein
LWRRPWDNKRLDPASQSSKSVRGPARRPTAAVAGQPARVEQLRAEERGLSNALSPLIRRVQLQFTNLPPGLDGFRILHLSDFHIDGLPGLAEVLVEKLPQAPVDLCVLTGDYRFEVKGDCAAIYPRMRRVLDAISSRHGIVGILGNHDCADIALELQKRGVRMLINDSFAIESMGDRLWVIGVDDPYYYGCDDLTGAMEGIPASDFKLLLAHTPELFANAESALIDLYLCGHTHAGQIRLPILGAAILNANCPRDFTYGHWYYRNMQGYTTSGVGCSLLPVRFGCPPEIAVIELSRCA